MFLVTQITYELAWYQTRVFAVKFRRLTA